MQDILRLKGDKMKAYQTIKTIGKGIKDIAIGGLTALVLTLGSGCAHRQATLPATPASGSRTQGNEEIVMVQLEPNSPSPINGYFGAKVGAIYALNETGTEYSKGSKTLGVELGIRGRKGLEFNLGLDFYNSNAKNTENGTEYSVENESTLATAGLVYNSGGNSPVKSYIGLVASNLNENTEITVGAPYNEEETMSNNMWGLGATTGVKMNSETWGFKVGATYNHWPKSENVKDTLQVGASVYKSF